MEIFSRGVELPVLRAFCFIFQASKEGFKREEKFVCFWRGFTGSCAFGSSEEKIPRPHDACCACAPAQRRNMRNEMAQRNLTKVRSRVIACRGRLILVVCGTFRLAWLRRKAKGGGKRRPDFAIKESVGPGIPILSRKPIAAFTPTADTSLCRGLSYTLKELFAYGGGKTEPPVSLVTGQGFKDGDGFQRQRRRGGKILQRFRRKGEFVIIRASVRGTPVKAPPGATWSMRFIRQRDIIVNEDYLSASKSEGVDSYASLSATAAGTP